MWRGTKYFEHSKRFLELFQSIGVEATILEDQWTRALFSCTGLDDPEERADAVAYIQRFYPHI